MKSESKKILIIGIICVVVLISIKQLIVPKGSLSFFISIIIAGGIGIFLARKIKEIEK
ncbi:hypothetical protein MBBAR_3c00990 [Methanobrevibacter arboriphilus JCM 13429 = DSM 1125]|uniref:Uncharacterized protein n=1 Tax=Methanobrevibacter arboriphilus JCM 13429 = DSM 1125 TaxID=1300164 RepID=A0A1V6N4D7_METAZ|nr:hypothetical protein [Methanobrevibacter arboriphilus]OQD59443.1 hypothetical protein MBBAR_3c00990 [Methanobrevibacter arboriphilus JCM 13429 = DSM 1125]